MSYNVARTQGVHRLVVASQKFGSLNNAVNGIDFWRACIVL